MSNIFGLAIIGSGPAGLTAAIYAARARLKTIVVEEDTMGGSIINADLIENFPGFSNGIPGSELAANLLSQVMAYNVEFKLAKVTGIQVKEGLKVLYTTEGSYTAKAVIIAGGARPRKLGIPGEEQFKGKGVFHCAMCDGGRFQNQEVAIIGGGDGGIMQGLYMTHIASKVTVIEITERLTATMILQERARASSKMEILCSTQVEAITGSGALIDLSIRNVKTGERSSMKVPGIFVVAGLEPQTEYLKGIVELDGVGQIMVNDKLETSVPGIFAAGDIRHGTARQAITAAGDGATAAVAAIAALQE